MPHSYYGIVRLLSCLYIGTDIKTFHTHAPTVLASNIILYNIADIIILYTMVNKK